MEAHVDEEMRAEFLIRAILNGRLADLSRSATFPDTEVPRRAGQRTTT